MKAEQRLLDGRRAFPMAQQLLAGVPIRVLPERVQVGWYDSQVDPESGAFAVVQRGGEFDDLMGKRLRILTEDGAEVFVYVLGARSIPTPIAVWRRVFLALALLSTDELSCTVEVVE